jgi:transketolase
VALVLTRQNVPTLDRTKFAAAEGLQKGAYVLIDAPNRRPDIVLVATGSEVSLVVAAGEKLAQQKVQARIVSMPSWELFDQQPKEYREAILPASVRARLAVEAALPQGWHRYVGDGGEVIGIERFGASAPGNVVMEKLGFSVDNVVERALGLLR